MLVSSGAAAALLSSWEKCNSKLLVLRMRRRSRHHCFFVTTSNDEDDGGNIQPQPSSDLSNNSITSTTQNTIVYHGGHLSSNTNNIDTTFFSKAVTHVLTKAKEPEKVYYAFLEYFKMCQNYPICQEQQDASRDDDKMMNSTSTSSHSIIATNASCEVLNRTMINLNASISFILVHLFKAILVAKPRKEDVLSFCVTTLGSTKFQLLVADFFMQQEQQEEYKGSKHQLHCNSSMIPVNLVVLIIGIQNSGKSTLASLLKKGARAGRKHAIKNTSTAPKSTTGTHTRPTMGVIPINMSYGKEAKIKFLDVGGQAQFRGVWESYYHSVHSVIYVIDASAPEETFQEAISVSKQSFGHRFMQGKPILVFCNKVDIPGSRSSEDICIDMNLNVRVDGIVRIVATSFNPTNSTNSSTWDGGSSTTDNNNAYCQHPIHKHTSTGDTIDPTIDHSIDWLLKKTLSNYQEINDRVLKDTQIVNAQRTKKRVSTISTSLE
jgi:small GTP-binding protein